MPHVVIDGAIDLRAFAQSFAPLHITETGDVLKTECVYIERSGRALVIEALAIEARRTQKFYVRVAAQDRGSVSVRIDPLTKPERSEGVKRIVACIGSSIAMDRGRCIRSGGRT